MASSTPPVSSAQLNAPQWNDDTLQPYRVIGDPLADAVISDIFSDGGVAAMNAMMQSFVANEHIVPENLHPAILRYLEQSGVLPPWADPVKIAAGENLFWRFGPNLVLVLVCYGLPFCYLGRNGVPVLALTNRLSSNSKRRIVETAQLLVYAMQRGGLTTDGGQGRLTIQKVRLMHAAIRQLAPTAPTWKDEYGIPVNQEDLAGTLMAFSAVSLDGLDKLGVQLTDSDREAYIHCWNVIGFMLGVREELLPANAAQARALAAAIAAHEFGPTPEGQALTVSLVEMLGTTLAGTAFENTAKLMIRYFLGRQWAEWLGIEEGLLAEWAAAPWRLAGIEFSGTIEDSRTLGVIAQKMGQALIDTIMTVERGGNRPSFAIPTELRQQWGVNWTS
jgi:hypothetical protein